jgi:hypothetical protein
VRGVDHDFSSLCGPKAKPAAVVFLTDFVSGPFNVEFTPAGEDAFNGLFGGRQNPMRAVLL